MTLGGTEPGTQDKPLRAILKLTYRCTNRCRFCRVDQFRGVVPDLRREDVVRALQEAKSLGVEMVLFSGGEPTLQRELPALARVATALGLKWGLITNARRLAYESYRKGLLSLGLSYVHTSLHGATPEIHNFLVQCDAFADVIEALRGLLQSAIELHVNTVITKMNIRELDRISDLLVSLWSQGNCKATFSHKLCLLEPRGLFFEHQQSLLVEPHVAAARAIEVVAQINSKGLGFNTEIEGFPICQVPIELAASLHSHKIMFMREAFEDRFYPSDFGDRTYPDACSHCALRPLCPGVYTWYADHFGSQGLKPFTEVPQRTNPVTLQPRED